MMKKMLMVLLVLAMMLSTACAMEDEIQLYRRMEDGTEKPLDWDSETSPYQAQLESGGVYRLTGKAGGAIKLSKDPNDKGTGPVTLTLDGVEITSKGTALRIDHSSDVNLILKGTNSLLADGNGLHTNGSVSIRADASSDTLNVTAGSDGIYSLTGDVTISGGTVKVLQAGGNGICSPNGDVTISGGTVKVLQAGDYGIFSPDGVTISGGTVEVHAGSSGIVGGVEGDVTISGGTVIAESTGGFGIGGGSVTISGKDTHVTASGYDGIGTTYDVTISDGTVVAQSNGIGKGTVSAGIHSDQGDVKISGGTVTAEATGETGRGIYCSVGDVTISDGDVRIMGRVKSIHAFAGLKVDDKLHSMGRYDGTTDWTPAAPEHVGGYQWAWFAPGVPVSFKLGGGAKTVRVPGNGTWLMPQPEMLGLTVPQGLAYTGVWMHNGAQYPIGARAPRISGGETFTMETVAVAAEDLPKTGDPSMLGAWAALLGASAMGLKKMKKKS